MTGRSLALALTLGVALGSGGAAQDVRPATGIAPSPLAATQLDAADVAVLIRMLAGAEAQGFGSDAFAVGDATRHLKALNPLEREKGEAQLKVAAVAYAWAQHGGRVPVNLFQRDWAIRPAPYDATAEFAAAAARHELPAWAASLPPPNERYARLVAAYGRYRQIAARGAWPALTSASTLKPGMSGAAVLALRRRLGIEDAATPAAAGLESSVYDAAMTAAVGRAQARYGLEPDGVAGPGTLAALNMPVERRLAQIRVNLERWRWAPRALPPLRVALNIPDASLTLYDAGAPVLTMRTIVGRAAKPTPMFADRITAVVLNPPWNVPTEIAAREIWPKIRRDPGYMAREGFVIRPGGGLQQKPGPLCALGEIKFELSNPFGVYLHDTPARALFARDDRALSHGCMRLEKPNILAKRLLAGDPAWPDSRIDLVLLTGKTTRAVLRRPVPVLVFYQTAFADGREQVQFRRDIYHWDEVLQDLLQKGGYEP